MTSTTRALPLVLATLVWTLLPPAAALADPTPVPTPTPSPVASAPAATPSAPSPAPSPASVQTAPAATVTPSDSTTPAAAPTPAEASPGDTARGADVPGRASKQRGTTGLVTLPARPVQSKAADKAVRVELPPTSEQPFSMVGVTWQPVGEPIHPDVQVRTRTAGTWTDWIHLDAEESDAGTRQGTSPAYVGQSDAVQVRLVTDPGVSAPTDVQVVLLAPTVTPEDATVASKATPGTQRGRTSAGAAGLLPLVTGIDPSRPAIVSRATWGAVSTVCDGPDATVRAVVVHHTEGTNTYSAAESAGIVRGIQAFHIDGRGWCDVGYNFLVDRYGVVFEGRTGGVNVPVHGAHAYTWNTTTAGISLMGSYTSVLPPEAQLQAAVSVTAWKLSSYYRSPYGQITIGGITSDVISGHRQVVSTDCPGQMLYDYLPTFRNRVAAAIGTGQSPIQQRWLALGGGSGSVGQPYAGETSTADGGRYTQFAGADIYAAGQRTYVVLGGIRARYQSVGGYTGWLGVPQSEENCGQARGGCYQDFAGGSIYWTGPTDAWPVSGAIRDRFRAIGAGGGPLGYPTGAMMCGLANGGCSQPFEFGQLRWTPTTGAWETYGGVWTTYARTGTERGPLGYATAAQVCDQPGGGCRQQFQGGLVIAPASGPGYVVTGAIATFYQSGSYAAGTLGYPLEDTVCTSSGCSQLFEGGMVTAPANGPVSVDTSSTGIFVNAVAGIAQQGQRDRNVPASVTIANAIRASRWGHGTLPAYGQNYFTMECTGTPSSYQVGCASIASLEGSGTAGTLYRLYGSVSDSFADQTASLAADPRYAAAFAAGSSDGFVRALAAAGYSTDPTYADTVIGLMQRYNLYRFDTGAAPAPVALTGPIGDAYAASGGAAGPLSFRVTAEAVGPVAGSRYVSFNKGMIAWSTAGGAHVLSGPIWEAYRRDGSLRSSLGVVTSNAVTRNGVVQQDFAQGRLYVSAGGAYAVVGDIWTRYSAAGAETGRLGYPLASATCGLTAGGCSQPFQRGTIWSSPGEGTWEVPADAAPLVPRWYTGVTTPVDGIKGASSAALAQKIFPVQATARTSYVTAVAADLRNFRGGYRNAGKVTAASNGETFMVGADGRIWHQYLAGSTLSGWSRMAVTPVPIAGTVSVGINSLGDLELYMVGTDKVVYHSYQTPGRGSGWSAWSTMGAASAGITGDIHVGRNASGDQELYVVGSDGQVWHNFATPGKGSGWFGWTPMSRPTTLAGDVQLMLNDLGNQELYVTGADGVLYHTYATPGVGSGWSAWSPMGTPASTSFGGAVTTAYLSSGTLDLQLVSAVGRDGTVYVNVATPGRGSGWSGWVAASRPGGSSAAPAYVQTSDFSGTPTLSVAVAGGATYTATVTLVNGVPTVSSWVQNQ